MRALIYTRVSHDPRKTYRSVIEQERECRANCRRRGWSVVDVLCDNDSSASRYAKRARPAWAEVKRRLAGGDADVLVVWEDSRATRDLAEYANMQELCTSAGVLFAAGSTVVDFTNPGDALTADVKAVVAKHEAAQTRARVQRAVAANAVAGRPHGRRLFGYRRVYDPHTAVLVGQEPDPDESAVVVEAVRRVLAGESLRTITHDLNRRSIPTGTGGPWSTRSVKRMVVNPAYAGRRVHQGRVIGDAAWPAIIDPADHARATGILNDPKRQTTRRRERVHLLTGAITCSRCGGPMTVGRNRADLVYKCREFQHLTISKDGTERLVVAAILARLEQPDAAAAFDDAAPETIADITGQVAELERRLEAAVEQYAAGELSATMLAKLEQRITGELDDLRRSLAPVAVPTTVDAMIDRADGVAAAWDALTVEQQFEVVASLCTVTVLPGRKAKHLDPARVRIDWRH
jgi:site-specific DNA recombinase